MMRQTQRQRRGGWRGWAVGVLLVALTGAALFGAWYVLGPSWFDFVEPEYFRELQNADLTAARPVPVKEASPPKGKARAAHDWPQWRGPHRDGLSRETDLRTTWPKELTELRVWEAPAGDGYSALAVSDGRAYTQLQDGDDEAVVCWKADSGEELWRFRYPCKYENPHGSGPRATPTVAGEFVYTVGGSGILHCLAAKTGVKVWLRDLLEEFGAKNLRWGVSFSPLVEGERLFVMPGGPGGNAVAALDCASGKTLWKALDDVAGYSAPVAATLAGQRQILFFTGDGLVSLTPESGRLLWRFPWATSYHCNIATPVVAGDYVFISSGYGHGCAVLKVEPQGNGECAARRVYENTRMCNHFSSSVLYEDHLYGFNEGVLTCLEFRTGSAKWKKNGFQKGSLLIADGRLIILGQEGTLAVAEATPAGYREQASWKASLRKCWTVPVLANGLLYLRDEARVLCLDVRKR